MSIKKRAGDIKNKKDDLVNKLSACTRVELTSDCEALIEGCKGILEYDDSIIRIAAKRFELRFTGHNLTLRSLSEEDIAIEGKILGIEFI